MMNAPAGSKECFDIPLYEFFERYSRDLKPPKQYRKRKKERRKTGKERKRRQKKKDKKKEVIKFCILMSNNDE
jgi:hypothetical protein